MPSLPAVDSYWFRLAVCVAVFAVSLVAFPLLALAPTVLPLSWPAGLGDVLFFWPQYLLLPSGMRSTAGAVYGADTATAVAVVLWLLLLALFARLTQRQRKLLVVPLLFVVVAICAELAMLSLGAIGFSPVLEGL